MSVRKIPSTISDFSVFPVALPIQKSFPVPATHYFYVKPHDPKVPDAASPRSLFVVNIPIDSTDLHLKHLFSTQLDLPSGRIEAVNIHDRDADAIAAVTPSIALPAPAPGLPSRKRKREEALIEGLPPLDPSLPPVWDRKIHRPGTNAVLVFVDKASMQACLAAVRQAKKEKRKIEWGEGVRNQVPALGRSRYETHEKLLRPSTGALMKTVDDYMTAFNAHTAARDRLLAEQRQAPDADGFVTVTHTAGRAGIKGVKHEAAKEKLEKQNKKQEGLNDFYRFQGRERAKQRAGELMKKFQDDVDKVQKIRERKGRMRPD